MQRMQYRRFSHTHAHVSYNADGNGQPDTTDTADCREEKLSGSEPLLPLPLLPEAEWPEPLQHIRSYGATGAQRDVLLLGALTVLGACMERNARCLYGGKMQSPCLQTFVVAPSAAGKGILGFVRLLIEPIHDEIRRQVEQQMSAYKKAKKQLQCHGQGAQQGGRTGDAAQQDVHHIGQQHRYRHPAEYHGFQRNGNHL